MIAPGLRADIAALDSLESCRAQLVLCGGRVVDDAAFAARGDLPPIGRNSVKAPAVTAQHFRPEQGVSNEDHPWYTMGNRYTAEVVRNGGLWQISRLVVKASWVMGSIDVVR